MPLVISKSFRFEASHVLPRHPGKCSRLHGHSWQLKVMVEGFVNPTTGFVMDYSELKALVNQEIVEQVDHQHLGVHDMLSHPPPGSLYPVLHYDKPSILPVNFYPTSENLVNLFGRILVDRLKALPRSEGQPEIVLRCIKLHETCTSEAIWYPE